jgi:phosphate butyryltransferase
MILKTNDIFECLRKRPKKKIVVISAEDPNIYEVVINAIELGIAEFILIGDKNIIEKYEMDNRKDINIEILNIKDHKNASEKGVSLVKEGKADTLMKGLLHTSTFLKAVLDKEKGLNKGGLISQISVFDKNDGNGLNLVTDCAMAIEPTLEQKISIIENAIELANKLGYDNPKVALISAVETVNPKIKDTLEAAILCKMAERGQIKGAVLDGPLALDNAISEEAAKSKGIESKVAGRADILIVPNLQVGNVLHKSLTYYANKIVASAVMGAKVPIIMTSRTDSVKSKLLTIALSCYISFKNDNCR